MREYIGVVIFFAILAFMIIYGSYFGIGFLQLFNAGNYNAGYFYLDETNNMVAMPSNFYLAFLGKNEHFGKTASSNPAKRMLALCKASLVGLFAH